MNKQSPDYMYLTIYTLTLGMESEDRAPSWLVMARMVSRPKDVLAGTAPGSNQNESQDNNTINTLGTYTWMT